MIKMEEKKCNICASSDLAFIEERQDTGYFKRNKIPEQERAFTIKKCLNCGFVFVTNPYTDQKEDRLDENVTEIPEPEARHFYIHKMLQKERNKNKELRVLEIGRGFGGLYKMIKKEINNYDAIELSHKRASVLRDYGYEVYTNTIEEYIKDYPDRKYDFVIMDNVLEHIVNPQKIIEQVGIVLNTHGKLLLIVPNYYDIRRFIVPGWKDQNLFQPVGHVNYFSARSLKYLLNSNGFKINHFPFVLPPEKGLRLFLMSCEVFFSKFFNFNLMPIYMSAEKIK